MRSELHSEGVEFVSVAVFERGGMAAARALIDKHQPEHPALYDGDHLLEAHLGMESVSTWLWADEEQHIVRPPEFVMAHDVPASAGGGTEPASFLPPALAESFREIFALRATEELGALDALRHWATHGADSPYALSPEEIARRSRPWSQRQSLAAAHSELGEHLARLGDTAGADAHFQEAYRLDPANYSYWAHVGYPPA